MSEVGHYRETIDSGSSLKIGKRIETKSNLQTEIRRFLTTLAFRSE
jgi:hypothetical protein